MGQNQRLVVVVVVVFYIRNVNPNFSFPHVTLSMEQHNSTTPPSCVLMLDRNASAAYCWVVGRLSAISAMSVQVCVTKES